MNAPRRSIDQDAHDPGAGDAPALDVAPPDAGTVVHRPDGWYWLGEDGRQEFGPYASADEARAEMHAAEDEALEPGESLLEAEDELGLAGWVDPDTGALAEDVHTRIEDH
jgi:hypothetical protein